MKRLKHFLSENWTIGPWLISLYFLIELTIKARHLFLTIQNSDIKNATQVILIALFIVFWISNFGSLSKSKK